MIDLSIGSPVDSTAQVVRDALAAHADAPGYPVTAGTDELRSAVVGWLARRFGVAVAAEQVLPTIGSKELVALLPSLLGYRGRVLFPALAYPTYEVGAILAGCEPVRVPLDDDGRVDVNALDAHGKGASLLWVNYPANPHGAVADDAHYAVLAEWCRARDVLLVSDECYAELGWSGAASTALGQGSVGVLAVHSLSKRSNLAGYRAGFVAGDRQIVARLLDVRRHAGLIVPLPIQAAMSAALRNDAHVEVQRARYQQRRDILLVALDKAGWTVELSRGGLYLWARSVRYPDCWDAVAGLADAGVLVAPGSFYGPTGAAHVRVALTAHTDDVSAAAERIGALA